MKLIDPPVVMPRKLRKNVERTGSFAFDFEAESKTGKDSDKKNAVLALPKIIAISSGSFDHAFVWGDDAQEIICYLLRQSGLEAVVHNALYDFVLLHHNDIISIFDVKATIRDTMVLQFMLDENIPKGLKGLVQLHLKYQMKTYKETTKDNPKNLRIKELENGIIKWEKLINGFDNVRPWPHFDSKKLKRRTKLKKAADAEADRRWPPTIKTNANGKTTRSWPKEARVARSEWRSKQHEFIEEKFSWGEKIEFQCYVDAHFIMPMRAEIEDLKEGLLQDELVYAADDSRQTMRLFDRLTKKLQKMEPAVQHWYELESRIRVTTLRMSCNGIHIDKEEARNQLAVVEPIIEELYGEVQNHCRGWLNKHGEPFNPNSGDQVREVLFGHLKVPIPVFKHQYGVPVAKLTPEGDKYCKIHRKVFSLNDLDSHPAIFWESYLSVDSEVLERIHHPIGMAILNYRTAAKLKSTYLQTLVDLETDRIYGAFNSVGPKTGRLSCVAEWTELRTPNGPVPIKDLKIGDEVWTHKGRWRPLLNVFTKGPGHMYDVRLSNGEVLTCTTDHKLLLSGGRWARLGALFDEYIDGPSGRPSHRQRPQEQLYRQLGSIDAGWAQSRALFAGEGLDPVTIKEVNYRGRLEVHDVTVADDASYEACGVISHNSASPNLQNIPSRKKPSNYDPRVQGIGPLLRRCYVAPPGKKMIVCDQSQIELRIITHFTQDKRLLKIYKDHVVIDGVRHYTGDIHFATSRDLDVQRKDAKGINFGLSYEMMAARFARMNRMFTDDGEYDVALAQKWRDGFFEVNAGLRQYLEMLTNCWDNGVTDYKMLTGRKRHFPAEYFTTGGKILNSKVQGSSADLLKLAMLVIDEFICPKIPSLKMIFQVHDELGFEVSEEDAELAGLLIKYVMEFDWIGCLSVPVLASAKVCANWEAKDDDNLPEIGTFYARIDGKDQLFTAENWSDMVEADNNGTIELKGATAMLTPEEVATCKAFIPAEAEAVFMGEATAV